MNSYIKRLQKEIKEIENDDSCNFSVGFKDDTANNILVVFNGPYETPYEDGMFKLLINIPDNYPYEPPKVEFKTKIFHPNIYENGNVCVSILDTDWKPIMTLKSVILSLISLLSDPNPDSPANTDASKLYLNDKKLFKKKARQYTRIYASVG